ncbi:hypothetical protein Lgee_1972 [Legionella geestiana]|uniref:Uncharacterized protein n=1 Tax=Legionella geestiana TaxID=45065 RepID=A0A0W0TNY3_9GAMM|nr:RMD1 family protein [Legionella geestiana]KTC97311.1 hypothetical protein Lgee_1972 [Legionella geestiana]QBS12438.1 RMD1 family protein [Legionella geestiana]QDQ39848.1 RMD1 family protein [Legionella geestiana]STX55121.1 Uncharacterised ACR, YagE family COG1723 [Legionella geestiana]
MECLSYCIANTLDLAKLDQFFKAESYGFVPTRARGVLKLIAPDSRQSIYLFKNGTLVSWGLKRYRMRFWLDLIRPFAEGPIKIPVHDEFIYRLGEKTSIGPHDYFDVDCVYLDEDSDELRLALSYGFSQSVKLQYFETTLELLIEKFSPLIRKTSKRNASRISRHKIRAVIGEILEAKSEMNLISNFLYHPKYFWQHPTLEEYYILLERYLHIQRRVNAINHRLDTLSEIFDMFNGYLENRHAHSLEIIIIVLITIEILSNVLNFHF